MLRLLGLVAVLAVVIVALGLYRGWFTVAKTENEQTHKISVTATVDKDKFKADEEKVIDKGKAAIDKGKELGQKVKGTVDKK